MKKAFLFSLLLMMLCSVGSSGQENKVVTEVGTAPITDASGLVAGQYYLLRHIMNSRGYVYEASDNSLCFEPSLNSLFTLGSYTNRSFIWKLTKSDDGSMCSFQNVATGHFLPYITKNLTNLYTDAATAGAYTLTKDASNTSAWNFKAGAYYLSGRTTSNTTDANYCHVCSWNDATDSYSEYSIFSVTVTNVLQAFIDAKALIDGKDKADGYTSKQLTTVISDYNDGKNCTDATAAANLQTAIDALSSQTKITTEQQTTYNLAVSYLNNANKSGYYSKAQLADLKVAFGDGSYENIDAIRTALNTLETTQTKITSAQYSAYKEICGYLGYPDAVGSYSSAQLSEIEKVTGDTYDFSKITSDLSTFKSTYSVIAFDNSKTYKIYNRFRDAYAMYDSNFPTYVSSNNAAGTKTALATSLTTDPYLWQVIQEDGKTYLYNKGAAKYISNASDAAWLFTTTKTPMVFTQYNDGSAVFYNIKIDGSTRANPYFNMSNQSGFKATYRGLASWTPSTTMSSGSAWVFFDVTALDKTRAQEIVANYDATKSDYVGMPTATTIDNLKTLLANETTTAEQYETAMDAAEKSKLSLITSDALFRIESAFTFSDSKTKAIYENGTGVAWDTEDATTVPMLWRFVANTDGTYRIQSANTKKEIGPFAWSTMASMVDENSGFSFTLNEQDLLKYTLTGTNGGNGVTLAFYKANAGGNVATTTNTSGTNLGSYNSTDGSKPTLFKLHKASSIDVAVSAAGYATLWLPFAVTVPTGVTVSGITKTTANTATLTDLAGSTLKAETPVVLKAAEGTYTFPFTSETGASIDGNLLTGTSTPTTVTDKASYVLALTSANKPGFCIAGALTIPVNKAYLLKSSIGESSKSYKELNFGGTTGIQSITTSDEKAPVYFDLAGRRVINPSHGVYIKNGKKVVIK